MFGTKRCQSGSYGLLSKRGNLLKALHHQRSSLSGSCHTRQMSWKGVTEIRLTQQMSEPARDERTHCFGSGGDILNDSRSSIDHGDNIFKVVAGVVVTFSS